MKIIRITTLLDFGGIERKMENLSYWKDDNEWIFVAIGGGGRSEQKIMQNEKQVYCLGLPYKILSIKSFWTLYQLYIFLKKEKPDVVHCAGAEANFYGIIAAIMARIPVKVSEEIGIPKHSRIAKIIFKIVFNLSDYVLGESKKVVCFIQNNYNISTDKVKQIPNFIINKNNIKRETDYNRFHIVSISRLEPVKNIQLALRVIKRLSDNYKNILYTIVGGGRENEVLQNLTRELQIEQYVHFVGFQTNPFLYLSKSDLYILTSFTEGFSNSLLEAMISGTPTLSTNVGSAEEIIQDGINGWIIPPDNDDELYDKIVQIIELPKKKREAIGQIGMNTIKENYLLESHMKQLMMLYEKD
ncbi:4-alpha-N-acetylgalactosaminyltransferase [termite gut metagenome]|uniref:4-alpha-N-acetylgalactosaminyltransferase n=2 Tax=termite gut metagenome TaxID=433724 RepID=A0A5J4SRS4_9ZZZZ